MSSSKIITLSGWDISQINNDMSMNDIMYKCSIYVSKQGIITTDIL